MKQQQQQQQLKNQKVNPLKLIIQVMRNNINVVIVLMVIMLN